MRLRLLFHMPVQASKQADVVLYVQTGKYMYIATVPPIVFYPATVS